MFEQEISAGLGLDLAHVQCEVNVLHGSSSLVKDLLRGHVPVIQILQNGKGGAHRRGDQKLWCLTLLLCMAAA